MKKTVFLFLFLLLIFSSPEFSYSQEQIQLDNWQTYSSLLNSVDADIDANGNIWVATNGGAYMYNFTNSVFTEYRNINALLSLDISSTAANRNNNEIYLGTFDGIIEINTGNDKWIHITDILKTNYPDRRINNIIFNGNIAYISGGFGLTTFDMNEHVFLQTPGRLGTFQPLTTVNQTIIVNNKLWAATDEGVAMVDLSTSIINPVNWKNYTIKNGLPEKKIKGIASFNNEIYCFTDTTINVLRDSVFVKILSTLEWDEIQALATYQNKLIYATLFHCSDLNNQLIYSIDQIRDTAKINNIAVNPLSGDLEILLKDAGFVTLSNNKQVTQVKPESPVSNLFTDLDIDINGNLWAATDYTGGKGIMQYKNSTWINYTSKTYPEILTDSYGRISCFPDGRIVASSWGYGALTLQPNGENFDFKITDATNSCLTGVNGNANYVVTGASAYDSRTGRSWIINYAPNFSGNLIMGENTNGEYTCSVSRSTREFIPMVIDMSGTKWMGSINEYGIVYFNEGYDFSNTADDKQGQYSSSNSQLPSNNINCLAVDQSDVIWVGTPAGLAYILSPSSVLRDADPIIKPSSLKFLASVPINSIMVDALNNKWIATNSGIYVLDPDGAVELAHLTTDNTPLITNEILDIATDPNSGKIWFGSRKGLSEAQSFAIKPLESYKIKCYPQPYNPEKDDNLTISGLAENSDIRITTIDGKLMKSIQTTSQKAVWDGRDEYGNYVPSGIYLIMGTSLSSDIKGIAKFAVIRN